MCKFVDVNGITCENQSNYNYPYMLNGIFCIDHKLKSMRYIGNGLCSNKTCISQAIYGYPKKNTGKIYCTAHARNDMEKMYVCKKPAILTKPKKNNKSTNKSKKSTKKLIKKNNKSNNKSSINDNYDKIFKKLIYFDLITNNFNIYNIFNFNCFSKTELDIALFLSNLSINEINKSTKLTN